MNTTDLYQAHNNQPWHKDEKIVRTAYENRNERSESNDALDVASNDTITENSNSDIEELYAPPDHYKLDHDQYDLEAEYCNDLKLLPSSPSQDGHNIDQYKHPKYIVKWSEKDVSGINYSRIKFNR